MSLYKRNYDVIWWIDLEHEEKWQYKNLSKHIQEYNKPTITNLNQVGDILNKYKTLLIFDNINSKKQIIKKINIIKNYPNIQNIFNVSFTYVLDLFKREGEVMRYE